MSLCNDKSKHRIREGKPKMWCVNSKGKHAPVVPVDSNTVIRCRDANCFCKQIDGWIGMCDYCGSLLHNCPWGCPFPLSTNVGRRHVFDLEYHYITRHGNQMQLMEFPVGFPATGSEGSSSS